MRWSVAKQPNVFQRPLTLELAAVYATCRDIDRGNAPGVYWVNPGTGALQMWCDPVQYGGGWTKLEMATWPFWFSASTYLSYNTADPAASSYSQVGAAPAGS
jgi:hypothetical protein